MDSKFERKSVIPGLRFSEFSNPWTKAKVKTFAPLQRGFDLTNSDTSPGKYPVVFSNGILKTHCQYRAQGPGVVTGRSGTIGKVTFVEDDFWPHNTSLWVTDFSKTCVKFIYFFYVQLDLSRFKAGSTVPTLNRNDVHDYVAAIPAIPEQKKIADFLTTVDARIGQLTQKKALLEDYKKGVMQQLFSQALRFKDDHGNDFPDWEEVELGDVLGYEQPTKYIVKSTDYSDEYSTPVLTAGKTFVLGYTDETQGVCDTGLPLIIFDDFTTAYKFVDFPFKVKSSAMKILRIKSSDWNIRFVHDAMSTIRFPRGEHKRYWIGEYQFMTIPAPSMDEQAKIANFLSAIDRKIESVATQITETQSFKRGLLQQMFV